VHLEVNFGDCSGAIRGAVGWLEVVEGTRKSVPVSLDEFPYLLVSIPQLSLTSTTLPAPENTKLF
jgi:hypothetical protein